MAPVLNRPRSECKADMVRHSTTHTGLASVVNDLSVVITPSSRCIAAAYVVVFKRANLALGPGLAAGYQRIDCNTFLAFALPSQAQSFYYPHSFPVSKSDAKDTSSMYLRHRRMVDGQANPRMRKDTMCDFLLSRRPQMDTMTVMSVFEILMLLLCVGHQNAWFAKKVFANRPCCGIELCS